MNRLAELSQGTRIACLGTSYMQSRYSVPIVIRDLLHYLPWPRQEARNKCIKQYYVPT